MKKPVVKYRGGTVDQIRYYGLQITPTDGDVDMCVISVLVKLESVLPSDEGDV